LWGVEVVGDVAASVGTGERSPVLSMAVVEIDGGAVGVAMSKKSCWSLWELDRERYKLIARERERERKRATSRGVVTWREYVQKGMKLDNFNEQVIRLLRRLRSHHHGLFSRLFAVAT